MKQMALRIFFYIWGSTIGTVAIVLMVAILLDLPPPGTMPLSAIRALITEAMLVPLEEGGPRGVIAFLDSRPDLSRHIRFLEEGDPACADSRHTVALAGNSCLMLVEQSGAAGLIARAFPMAIPLVVGLIISVVAAFFLARRYTGPLRRIGEGLEDLSRGHLDHRIGNSLDMAEPALRDISHAFDSAAEKLQELTAGRTRLFHDLSHEIRSPLARLKAALAILERSPERQPAILPRMDNDIERMDRLVGEVLTLARFEHIKPDEIRREPIDLIELLDPILRDATFEGQADQTRIDFSGPDSLEILADAELLHRAFENILRNALRYSPPGGTIYVKVAMEVNCITVSFEDEGPGFHSAEAVRVGDIFSPFFRSANSTGTGLGLTIAEQSLRAHEGRISAQNNTLKSGLTIRCELPASRLPTTINKRPNHPRFGEW